MRRRSWTIINSTPPLYQVRQAMKASKQAGASYRACSVLVIPLSACSSWVDPSRVVVSAAAVPHHLLGLCGHFPALPLHAAHPSVHEDHGIAALVDARLVAESRRTAQQHCGTAD